jgi:multiple antibiotic resistance protein
VTNFIELFSYVFLVIGGLIPIANPFSTAPLFLALTSGFSEEDSARTAKLCTIYMFAVLTSFLFAGVFLLSFFGVSLPSLRIAGGMVIAYIGFRMLFPPPLVETADKSVSGRPEDIAFTPLTMPMLSGPGSISVIIAMASEVGSVESLIHRVWGYSLVTLGIGISAFICWLVLRASPKVVMFMGKSGIDALTKVMGFFLICIGVEFVGNGIDQFLNKAASGA